MKGVMGFLMVDKELRQLPKYALTLEELNFAFGTADFVRSLRRIGALVPTRMVGKSLIYDAGDVALVYARFLRGEYDKDLTQIGK